MRLLSFIEDVARIRRPDPFERFLADRVSACWAEQERRHQTRIDEEGCGAVIAAVLYGDHHHAP